MNEFKREHDRYIVIKRKDLTQQQAEDIDTYIDGMNIRTRKCVVVESNWPIYGAVWNMIQRMSKNIPQMNQECNKDTEIRVCHKEIDDLLHQRDNLQGELKEATTLIAKQSETITKLKQDNDNYQLLVPSLNRLVKYAVDRQLGTSGEDAVDVIIRYCEKMRESVNDPNPTQNGFYKVRAHKKDDITIGFYNIHAGWSFVAQKEQFSNVYRVIEKVEV